VLTVVDQFTRECLLLLADSSLTGDKVALALSQVIATREAPVSITVDNELSKKANGCERIDEWDGLQGKQWWLLGREGDGPSAGSLRVGAPSRVRSQSSPADAALDRRRHCG
jgi:hypothetical protein